MKINTVAILGAGAIGAYFIWGLSEKLGENLWIVADGDRKKRLTENGIIINDRKYNLNVKSPKEAKGVDLLLVCVKYGALRESLDDIAQVVDDHTTVVSLLNGVDSEQIISERIGKEKLLYSIIKIASQRVGNHIKFDGPATFGVCFGEQNGIISERVNAVAEVLSDTELHYQISEEINREIWFKYALNISRNLPQAIVGCGVGAYDDSEHMAYISNKLREEVAAVAAAKGIDISHTGNGKGKSSPSEKWARYSTLQDIDAGRHTEIDMFSGTLIRLGKELQVPTPYNELVYHVIKSIEEKNDGLFDYQQ